MSLRTSLKTPQFIQRVTMVTNLQATLLHMLIIFNIPKTLQSSIFQHQTVQIVLYGLQFMEAIKLIDTFLFTLIYYFSHRHQNLPIIMMASLCYDLAFHTITGISLLAIYLLSKLHMNRKSMMTVYFYFLYFIMTYFLYHIINFIFLGHPLPTISAWMIFVNFTILLCGWYYAQYFLTEYAAI